MLSADLGAVEALADAVYPNYFERPEIFAERLRLAPDTCFVLAGTAIDGYLIAHPWAGPPPPLDTLLHALPATPDHLYLHDLALAPAARGQDHAQAIVARLPGPAALVAVGRAAPFWSRLGFIDVPGPDLTSYGPGATYMRRPG